jgi:SH3-like domain-containing protein
LTRGVGKRIYLAAFRGQVEVSAVPGAIIVFVLGLIVSALWLGTPATAADSGRTVPRFVSLRAGEVNVRAGPGTRYPVEWVLTRQALPIEVVAEFENWRRIRARDGTEGWVHLRVLAAKRTVIVEGTVASLRREPQVDAQIVARVEPGVIGRLVACNEGWCRVEAQGVRGWLPRDRLWGVYPGEKID